MRMGTCSGSSLVGWLLAEETGHAATICSSMVAYGLMGQTKGGGHGGGSGSAVMATWRGNPETQYLST